MSEIKFPKTIPYSTKLVWKYEDCFSDYPTSKLCSSFLHVDYSIDMHKHEFFEINLVVSGDGVHYSEKECRRVKRGDVFIIPPNTLHGYRSLDGLNVYHAIFRNAFFQKYSNDFDLISSYRILFEIHKNKMPIYFRINDERSFSDLHKTFVDLEDSLKLKGSTLPQSTDFVKSYLLGMDLIIKLCDAFTQSKSEEKQSKTEQRNLIYKSIDYIHNNYQNRVTIDELCKISMMSRTPFFKLFKEVSGVSPVVFLNNYRIKVAEKYLSETNFSIQEIAEKTGYYDSSHFVKAYKKCNGSLPSSLRKG